jgi:hypothetical protein
MPTRPHALDRLAAWILGYANMPNARKAVRYSLEILAIAAPLAAMTYFLFDPDAFNAFMDWLIRVL